MPVFAPEHGPVYTDGAALLTSHDGLSTGTFAAVQLRGDCVGCGWVGLTGQVPAYLSPTAAAAERLALATATLFVQPGRAVHFRTDCQSAAQEVANLASSVSFTRTWSALWRQIDGRTIAAIAHVKGHQEEPPHGSRLECHLDACGSRLADHLVGTRAAGGGPPPLALKLVEREMDQLRALAVAVAKRLACWPPLESAAARAARRRCQAAGDSASKAADAAPPATLHPIQPHLCGWRCGQCMRFAVRRSAPVFAMPCEGIPAAWSSFLATAHEAGHSLWAARVASVGTAPIAFCLRCGAYSASGRACGLARACAAAPVSEGARGRLRLLRERRRPLRGLPLTAPVRVVPPCGAGDLGGPARGEAVRELSAEWEHAAAARGSGDDRASLGARGLLSVPDGVHQPL